MAKFALGNWGVAWTVDFWQGELQIRIGCVGLHFASVFVDRDSLGGEMRYWSGVRLYLGTGHMRLVDRLEWQTTADETFPALRWWPLAPQVQSAMWRYPRPMGRLMCRWRAVLCAWELWDIVPHGDNAWDNISLRTAWDVAKGIWLDGVA